MGDKVIHFDDLHRFIETMKQSGCNPVRHGETIVFSCPCCSQPGRIRGLHSEVLDLLALPVPRGSKRFCA